MIKVIKQFFDLQDGDHCYKEGDTSPRRGGVATEEPIAELASDKNKLGVPLIIVKETPKKPKKADTE